MRLSVQELSNGNVIFGKRARECNRTCVYDKHTQRYVEIKMNGTTYTSAIAQVERLHAEGKINWKMQRGDKANGNPSNKITIID